MSIVCSLAIVETCCAVLRHFLYWTC